MAEALPQAAAAAAGAPPLPHYLTKCARCKASWYPKDRSKKKIHRWIGHVWCCDGCADAHRATLAAADDQMEDEAPPAAAAASSAAVALPDDKAKLQQMLAAVTQKLATIDKQQTSSK